jgi:hypothetical protein
MTEKRISLEIALYALVLLLSLSVRLLNLGAMPLSDFEASNALHALEAVDKYEMPEVERSIIDLNSFPSYNSLTGLTAFLFDSTNFLARIWPALVGASLVLVPFFFRSLLGRKAALILAFVLALDPGLVAISRLGGGQMLAIGFGLWSLTFAYLRKPIWSGVFAGLALLSGPTALHGLLGLAATWLLIRLLGNAGVISFNQVDNGIGAPSRRAILTWSVIAGVTIVLAGSIFVIYPQGVSDWVAIFPSYLAGWLNLTGVPALRLIAILAVFQPLALVFGVIASIRGWIKRKPIEQMLSLWLIISFMLIMVYPSRQVGDLVWVLIPLWSLAGLELARSFVWDSRFGIVSLGQAALIFLIMILFWLNLSAADVIIADLQSTAVRLGVLGGVVALAAVVTVLVTYGWSWQIARRGLVWGFCLGMGVFGFANMWNATQLNLSGNVGVWHPYPLTADEDLLVQTVQDLSNWNTGRADNIDVTVVSDAPSLRWALRDISQVNYLSEGELPNLGGESSIVLTLRIQEAPSLADSYRGQDFAWWSYPDWGGALPGDFYKWLLYRSAPVRQEHLILWAREDLFPGGYDLSQSKTPILPDEALPVDDAGQE